MITINLIPEAEKKELRVFNLYLMIKNIVYLLLTSAILIAIALLLTKFILQNHFNKTINQIYITASANKFSSNEIEKFKQELDLISEIQQNYLTWSNLFLNFQNLVNEGITITHLDIKKENEAIKIRGMAQNRADLISFKENLDQSGYFEAFEIPFSVLLQKENINFNFDLKVNLEKITVPF